MRAELRLGSGGAPAEGGSALLTRLAPLLQQASRDGAVLSATPCALLVRSFSGDPTVEDFRCEPALSPVPSRPHGTPLPRMPASAEWSLVGQPTGLAEPAARLEPGRRASACRTR